MPMKQMTEVEMVKRAKSDPEAFGWLYDLNYKRIFNYILYSTGDVELSLDLTSETFLKALRALPKYENRGAAFTSWLYKIASREIAIYFRKRGQDKTVPLSYFPSPEDLEAVRRGVSPGEVRWAENWLSRCEDFITLAPLLRKLPPRYREVVFLRFYEGSTFEEIAGLLGRKVGTVKSQNHRALKLLKKMMQPSASGEHSNIRGLETSPRMCISNEEVE